MALSYIGGKSKIGKWIVPFYPNDMETYVEPFSGMFWCFFNMNLNQFPNLKRVVYNEFNTLNQKASGAYIESASNMLSIKALGNENMIAERVSNKEILSRDIAIKKINTNNLFE
jgi:hypothetical protein